MTSVATLAESFVEQFDKVGTDLTGSGLPWLFKARQDGLAQFASTGFPARKVEAWKYTNLSQALRGKEFVIAEKRHAPGNIDVIPSLLPGDGTTPRLVFVNGGFRPELSTADTLPEGVVLESFDAALSRDPAALQHHLDRADSHNGQPLLALNTAFMKDGFILRVPRGTRVDTPIEIIFIGGLTYEPIAYHPRSIIILEENSAATIIEHHIGVGDGAYFANSATEIRVDDGAFLRHYSLQNETGSAVHIATVHAEVGHDATYETFELAMGSDLARREVSVRLAGQGAHCNISGAYLLRDQQHCDNTTRIQHAVPNTTCREVFNGVVDDHGRAVFQGKILIDPQAQQSNGHQLSRALLLSKTAEVDMKPELEIYADDVLCSHGATTGKLNDEALYYLRSRGLTEARARRLLIESFIKEALEEVSLEPLRESWADKVSSWLAQDDRVTA